MSLKSDPTTWKDPRHRLGWAGERLARCYLEGCGWKVLERRYRIGRTEVDLIVQRGGVVAFVEVKARWSTTYGHPLEAVGWVKKRDIARAAGAWIDRSGSTGKQVRFDVIGVSWKKGRAIIEHVKDAFRPGWR